MILHELRGKTIREAVADDDEFGKHLIIWFEDGTVTEVTTGGNKVLRVVTRNSKDLAEMTDDEDWGGDQ